MRRGAGRAHVSRAALAAVAFALLVLARGAPTPAPVLCQAEPEQPCGPGGPGCPDGCVSQVPGVKMTCHRVGERQSKKNERCYPSPRAYLQPCIPGSEVASCAAGLACHGLLGRCFKDPPGETDPCVDKCAPGLTCDMTVKRCVAPADAGANCHEYGKPCKAGHSCDPRDNTCYATPRAAKQRCTPSGPAACGPGLVCDAATETCIDVPAVGRGCHAGLPCGPGLECHPFVNECYNKPRQRNQPCGADHPCAPELTCDPATFTCQPAPSSNVNMPCSALRPCGEGLECMPGAQRCYNRPRLINQPCVGPRGIIPCGVDAATGLPLVCDSKMSGRCVTQGDVNAPCWESRPCRERLSCSPSRGRCYDMPRGTNDPCQEPEEPCGAGLMCHPTQKRCVNYINERNPCFKLPNGQELKCVAPFVCMEGDQRCWHLPGDANDPCSLGWNKMTWACRAGLACSREWPYCT